MDEKKEAPEMRSKKAQHQKTSMKQWDMEKDGEETEERSEEERNVERRWEGRKDVTGRRKRRKRVERR